MKVRTQLMLILFFVFVSLMMLSVWFKFRITKENRALLEQKLIETREKDVPLILEQNANKIRSYTYYYSGWDQLADFITTKKDISWANEVLSLELSVPEIDYIWVADSEGKPYSNSTTKPSLASTQLNITPSKLKNELAKREIQVILHRTQ